MSRVLLAGVQFRPHRVTLGGALGGLLAAAGRDLPQPELMGLTGLGFRLTVDLVLSPSGPVQINFHDLFPVWENLGAWFKRTVDREESLARIEESLQRGMPAIAYDLLDLPEYCLVVGSEPGRLACLTLQNPAEPAWMEVAAWPPAAHAAFTRPEAILLLDLAPGYDRHRAVRESLRYAVDQFWAPPSRDQWLQHGLKAYEFWIATLASAMPLHGPEAEMGHAYNLLLLHRARRDAAAYLTKLAEGEYPVLEQAAAAYLEVAGVLEEATGLVPFPGQGLAGDLGRRRTVADLLRRTIAAERRGVDAIERALRALR